jgi:hypothetical protein
MKYFFALIFLFASTSICFSQTDVEGEPIDVHESQSPLLSLFQDTLYTIKPRNIVIPRFRAFPCKGRPYIAVVNDGYLCIYDKYNGTPLDSVRMFADPEDYGNGYRYTKETNEVVVWSEMADSLKVFSLPTLEVTYSYGNITSLSPFGFNNPVQYRLNAVSGDANKFAFVFSWPYDHLNPYDEDVFNSVVTLDRLFNERKAYMYERGIDVFVIGLGVDGSHRIETRTYRVGEDLESKSVVVDNTTEVESMEKMVDVTSNLIPLDDYRFLRQFKYSEQKETYDYGFEIIDMENLTIANHHTEHFTALHYHLDEDIICFYARDSIVSSTNRYYNWYDISNKEVSVNIPFEVTEYSLLENASFDEGIMFNRYGNFTAFDIDGNISDIIKNLMPVSSLSDDLSDSFSVYPNPTQDELTIVNNELVNGEYRYIITDISGKKAAAGTVILSNGYSSINTQELPKGGYMLNIENKNILFVVE